MNRKYKFKIETYSERWPNHIVIRYKKRIGSFFWSGWNTMTCLFDVQRSVHCEPDKYHPLFFTSFKDAEEYCLDKFSDDNKVDDHFKKLNEDYKNALKMYNSNSVIKTKYIK